jgi:UV DNA damage endonuclease
MENKNYKLATCCLLGDIPGRPDFGYKTTTKTAFLKTKDTERLLSLWVNNINKTREALLFLASQDSVFHYFRISSDIFPLATLAESHDFYKSQISYLQSLLTKVGEEVRALSPHFRIVTHPGQFCVPNSVHPHVVKNAIIELQYHYDFMSALGMPFSINIHCSGKGTEAKDRMVSVLQNDMPSEIKRVLSLENDEKCSSISEIIDVCSKTGVMPCFDIHHEAVNETFRGSEVYEYRILSDDQCKFIEDSWHKNVDLTPTMHISNRLNQGSLKNLACAHSDFLYEDQNYKLLHYINRGWDIEIEAKAKFPAVQKFYEHWSPVIK